MTASQDDSERYILVQIYCTVCGNRGMTDLATGREVPARYKMTRAQMIHVLEGTCVFCGGAMGIQELPDEEES